MSYVQIWHPKVLDLDALPLNLQVPIRSSPEERAGASQGGYLVQQLGLQQHIVLVLTWKGSSVDRRSCHDLVCDRLPHALLCLVETKY